MPDHAAFRVGSVILQSGVTLPDVQIAYQTYGELSAARDNAVLMPTFFAGQHGDTELMMGPGRALDPSRYFIIVPDLLGNGLSSSPSNVLPPFDGPAFPHVTVHDNVRCQHRLITDHLGIEHLRLVVGYSMGAQQAFHWAALHPEMVSAIAPICGTAKTSAHNDLVLEGVRTALCSATDFRDGWYEAPPVRALLAFGAVFASVVLCSRFYREQEFARLGLASPADAARFFAGSLRRRDANDLLTMLWTWQHADISDNEVYAGDLTAALAAIRARAIVMPSTTDFLCQVLDSEAETAGMPDAQLRPLVSAWGHVAGLGASPSDNEVIDTAIIELLAGVK